MTIAFLDVHNQFVIFGFIATSKSRRLCENCYYFLCTQTLQPSLSEPQWLPLHSREMLSPTLEGLTLSPP